MFCCVSVRKLYFMFCTGSSAVGIMENERCKIFKLDINRNSVVVNEQMVWMV